MARVLANRSARVGGQAEALGCGGAKGFLIHRNARDRFGKDLGRFAHFPEQIHDPVFGPLRVAVVARKRPQPHAGQAARHRGDRPGPGAGHFGEIRVALVGHNRAARSHARRKGE